MHCEEHRQKPHGDTFNCPKYQETLDFIEEMIPDLEPFRWPEKDHCYCQSCYPRDSPDVQVEEGGKNYIIPRDWVGIAIAIPEHGLAHAFNWDVVFHGTMAHRVTDILHHRHIGMPGDRLPDGSILRSINCCGRDDAQFYTSPTINYAGLQMYATAKPWAWGEKATQVVLQCRQDRTKLFMTRPETMGFKNCGYKEFDVCSHTSLFNGDLGIELLSKLPDTCIPYRIMMRTFPGHKAPEGEKPPTRERHPHNKETFRSPYDPVGKFRKDKGVFTARWYGMV